MALRETAAMLKAGEHTERNLMAARTGQRLSFGYYPLHAECRHCGLMPQAHVRETGILFCPEWALRERWGS